MFKQYMHIERLESDEVAGILEGTCYVFPKIDGTNASVWWNDGYVYAGSRTRELTLKQDNAGFCEFATVANLDAFQLFFAEFPDLRIHGEWLVPHTLHTYRMDAWRQFYIFDIYSDDEERYLSYGEYMDFADILPFPIIAPLEIVEQATPEHLVGLLDRNTYLIKDGAGAGEGIVIKRYDFVNQWGRTVWAKIVRNEFKERNAEAFGVPKVKMGGDTERKLAQEYVTRGRVVKALADMRSIAPLTSKRIPELLGRVWHEIITSEMWDIVKKHKKLVIDFSQFQRAVTEEIKKNCPELFG